MSYFTVFFLVASIIGFSSADYLSTEELTKKFQEIDDNNDGFIDLDELRDLGYDDNSIFMNVLFFDADKDGKFSLEEFLLMHSREGEVHSFKITDKNNDGYVSLDELRATYLEADELHADDLADDYIDLYDTDDDGLIDIEELKRLVEKEADESDEVNEEFLATLNEADTNGDKKVSKQELREYFLQALNRDSSERAEADFLFADKDNDKKLSLEEYLKDIIE